MNSYHHVRYCVIVRDLPLWKKSVCSSVCVWRPWLDKYCHSEVGRWLNSSPFFRMGHVAESSNSCKDKLPRNYVCLLLNIILKVLNHYSKLYLKRYPNWKPFRVFIDLIYGTLRKIQWNARKCWSGLLKSFYATLCPTRSCKSIVPCISIHTSWIFFTFLSLQPPLMCVIRNGYDRPTQTTA